MSLPDPYRPDPRFARTRTPLWAARGGFITELSSVNHLAARDKLGVKVYYVQLAAGQDTHVRNEVELTLIRRQLDNWGFQIVGWSPVLGDPVGEAELAAHLVDKHNLAGWVSDHEDWTERTPGNSGKWLQTFRTHKPNCPLMISCLPGPRPGSLDPLPWLAAGADIAPMCYEGEVGPTGAVWWSANYWLHTMRLPRNRVHPTLGVDKNTHPWSMRKYLNEMRQWGLGGYSLWHLAAVAPAV